MLIGTDQNNALFWGWNNRSTVRNVSILLILLCIGLVSILFFLEETTTIRRTYFSNRSRSLESSINSIFKLHICIHTVALHL